MFINRTNDISQDITRRCKMKIYKITNTIDNAVYIGCTSQTLEERFKNHKTHARLINKQAIHKHMSKLGVEYFNIELLEEVENNYTKDSENKYMNLYKEKGFDVLNKYNSNSNKVFYSKETETGIVKQYNCYNDLENTLNRGKVSECLNSKTANSKYKRFTHAGRLWSYENTKESWNQVVKRNNKKIAGVKRIVNKTTGEIFDSIKDASSLYTNVERSTAISNCLKKRTKTAFGFEWDYL